METQRGLYTSLSKMKEVLNDYLIHICTLHKIRAVLFISVLLECLLAVSQKNPDFPLGPDKIYDH